MSKDDSIPVSELYHSLDDFLVNYFRFLNPIFHRYTNDGIELNENQIKVLMAVSKTEQISPSEISKLFMMPKTSLTTIVRSLVDAGFLIKKTNTKDSRKFLLELTPKGQQFIIKKNEFDISRLDSLLGGMMPDERKRVIDGFNTLNGYFDREGNTI
ncbi:MULTISPECIES: MarR family winged helix-turn-helix transcriptional regulator [unclassified Oceanispirochaeta]|uniref:MarR family winged helix-turn-helix transcriptional regulator n=1 Tax=unclassified Oceanispirochaeta TaxID=2635722 RepID=UPI000E093D5F|nr:MULTISPECIES: MarR family winged helix-turn-helix transcriptional regulator [unclassified Oceanispirochaeta]MBF9014483.1 winged helix-turn-helix transcriptional regulator [Oceanispirochaeta sp. M2]NPD70739.1 winged helix-turn-helix transcriptional regulator [Oceanispirochaeta sp. M1]RDG34020.1 MarR family transcriptional regulator [Oceanispirochaeta sp. M1]